MRPPLSNCQPLPKALKCAAPTSGKIRLKPKVGANIAAIMKTTGPLRCFCSMRYGSAKAEKLFSRIASICSELGLEATPGGSGLESWADVRGKLQDDINESLVVVVDTSAFSWWVAFEFFYAFGRKICIPIASVTGLAQQDPQSAHGLPGILSNIDFIRCDPSHRRSTLDSQLRTGMLSVFNRVAAWSNRVSEGSLVSARARPSKVVPAYVSIRRGKSIASEQLFAKWAKTGDPINSVVIGPPGSGKTLLLTEFARWVNSERDHDPQKADDLLPVALFLSATALPETLDLVSLVRGRVAEWGVQGATIPSGHGQNSDTSWLADPGLFEPFLVAGRIHILIDGLDEFFVRRRDQVSDLLKQLAALRDAGARVIVSCRENLWVQQLRSPASFDIVRMVRFDQHQAMELLDGVKIPTGALTERGLLKDWLLNPLFLGFIRTLSQVSGGPIAFCSRTDLYDQWAKGVAREASERLDIDSETVLKIYGGLAIALLQSRKKTLSIPDVWKAIERIASRKHLPVEYLTNTEVLQVDKGSGEIGFSHESIYEFFVARALTADFAATVAETSDPAALAKLNLSHVELDYPQASVYGFLEEMLENTVRLGIPRQLSKLTSSSHLWRLLRNCIEYIGMTHGEDSNNRPIAFSLMEIAEDPMVVPRVRYNALRALERVHPGAPRPYYRHASDWGELDYDDLVKIASQPQEARPWVMRGYGKREPAPGRHWAWEPNGRDNPDEDLQEQISHRLGMLLESAIQPPISDDVAEGGGIEGVAINASHAWIRWFHRSDRGLLDELKRKADSLPQCATHDNLSRFVDRGVGMKSASDLGVNREAKNEPLH